MNDSNIGIQFNMQQMLNMLSASLYKDSVLKVATRELLQNSFDAVKHRPDPRIDVKLVDRTLEFKDNGIGMSPDTVRNVFFTIGGTAKEGLDPSERSGGFGIAKVQFFMAAEHLYIESVRDGIKTVVDTTQQELLSSQSRMENVINEYFPAIGEMASRAVEVSQVEWRITVREQHETVMLEGAYRYGQCHIALREDNRRPIDVFNELPDYIMIKGREFKKNLDRAYIRYFGKVKIPFALYTAVDGNIKEAPAFIWLKKSQVRATRVLTIKY